MLIPSEIPGFAFLSGDNSHEVQAIVVYCLLQKVQRRYFHHAREIPPGWIAVGHVPWCSAALGQEVVPDYYPAFLTQYLHRKVWPAQKWPLGERVFIKPADRHKRFNGFVTSGTYRGKKHGPYWCSEVVLFKNEWRYYITDGQVVAAHWYLGDELSMPPAPPLSVGWPAGWCGTADFGQLDDGTIALVEAHPPFAAGWYGSKSDNEVFAEWLVTGWRWLQSNHSKQAIGAT